MKPNTVESIDSIGNFRKTTHSKVCFTLDAGANVHVLYPSGEKKQVQQFIKNELSKYCKDGTYIDDVVGFGAWKNNDERKPYHACYLAKYILSSTNYQPRQYGSSKE